MNMKIGDVSNDDINDIASNENDKKTSEQLDTYFTAEVSVPVVSDYRFSWRRLWAFTGPGFLMSIAYLDPGNIESDLQSGTVSRYRLLWVLVWSTIVGLFMQRLAARLGVVTGKHLAEVCYIRYPKVPRILLWIMSEIAIIGSDMQEVIGTAVSIYLLSNRTIPLYAGVLLTILDTFSFLLLDRYGLRKLEAFFALLIAIMAITFGYEFIKVKPLAVDIAKGVVIPYCEGCDSKSLLQAVGIIGCIIMPHNLYLHSALVKSRKVDRKIKEEISDANRYVFIEAVLALGVSLMINIFVTSVFAHELYGKSNADVLQICKATNNSIYDTSDFEDNNKPFDADLYKAGIYMGCQFGAFAMYIWAVGIFAAGQSSTMTGTYSGQFVMEGFLNLKWDRWKRVLLTRTIAIAPTLAVTLTSDIGRLTGMNDYLNALMSIMLPFALLPVLTFTSNVKVMGQFVNGIFMKCFSTIVSFIVISINLYFVIDRVYENGNTLIYTLVAIFGVLYIIFIIYLIICYSVVLLSNPKISIAKPTNSLSNPRL
ncbi:natural resistance-associated macrophage protein 2-like [Oppia nitens]|uniref:natural resistance-associated macrophage protein 2-like n=1 Tax=Oppia nitens TaxID=1686743 RepID=UPI0023DB5530|nr:natural resistance-associated macrophage protein 2-like [Oppia nitens]